MVIFDCVLVSLCQVRSYVLPIAGEVQLVVCFEDDPRQALKLRVQTRFAACQANMLCAADARLPGRLGSRSSGRSSYLVGVTAQTVGAFQITARGGKQDEVFEHTIIKQQLYYEGILLSILQTYRRWQASLRRLHIRRRQPIPHNHLIGGGRKPSVTFRIVLAEKRWF